MNTAGIAESYTARGFETHTVISTNGGYAVAFTDRREAWAAVRTIAVDFASDPEAPTPSFTFAPFGDIYTITVKLGTEETKR